MFRSRGVWIGRLTLPGLGRKEVTGQTRNEVLKKLNALRDGAEAKAALGEAGNILVADQLARWLEDVARPRVAPSTFERYADLVRLHLAPRLGDLTLADARAAGMEALFSALHKAGVVGSTARQCWGVLASCLKHAVRHGLIRENPLAGAERPRLAERTVEVFTQQEVKAILAAAEHGTRRLRSRHGALFALALGTGARRGELLALYWPDVSAGSIRVERSLTWDDGKPTLKEPKSRRGRRSVTLPAFAREALEEHRSRAAREGHQGSPVFCSQGGGWVNRRGLQDAWEGLLKRAGVAYRRLHVCRHTNASQLLALGVSVMEVARRIGDRPQTVLATYAHWMPGAEDVADKLDRVYGRPAGSEGGVKVESRSAGGEDSGKPAASP